MTGCFCLEVTIGPLAVTQNKMLSLTHYQQCHGSQVDMSYCVNGFHADSCHKHHLFGCSDYTFHGTGFYLLFSKDSKLLLSDMWFRFNVCYIY